MSTINTSEPIVEETESTESWVVAYIRSRVWENDIIVKDVNKEG